MKTLEEVLFEIMTEQGTKDLKKNLGELIELIDILIFLNEKLAEQKTKTLEWEKYFETLLLKFCFHGISLHKVLSGINFESKYYKSEKIKSIEILDISSAKALLRAQFETFLMFHHIYINPKNDSEKELRYCAWICAALMRRQEYPANDKESQEQRNRDANQIASLQMQIKKLEAFKNLTDKQQKQLLEKGSGKLFSHWESIIEHTGINDKNPLKFLYEYLSIYSHSEGLSAIQLKTTKFLPNNPHNQSQAFMDANNSKFLTSVMIMELISKYPILMSEFEKLPFEIKIKIKLYSKMTKETNA